MTENRDTSVTSADSQTSQASSKPHWLVRSLLLVAGLAVLAGAVAMSVHWLSNRPKASRGKPSERIPLVETRSLERGTHEVTVRAMGVVMAADRVEVSTQVKGVVVEVNPLLAPGGHVRRGERLVRIEPEDFELAVQEAGARLDNARLNAEQKRLLISQARSSVAQAETALKLERGRSDVARREFDLLGEAVPEEDRELVLRTPQLRSAQAAYDAAEASLAEAKLAREVAEHSVRTAEAGLRTAELALERTSVEAPFNGVVQSKAVSSGAYLAPGSPVGTLINSDVYWVRVTVPPHQLKWIRTAQENAESATTVDFTHPSWEKGQSRSGRVLKLAPSVEESGRMAQLIVEVRDPRSLKPANEDKPGLMLGTLVEGTMHGASVPDCVRIPRAALHDGDTVWIKTDENTLDIRRVRIRARLEDAVLACDGLKTGDRLITSDLGAPVQDMKVQEMQKNSEE
ncbi:MAG: efflux RND transporter periplasmic adaptor subunit [Verrucomicrobiota bacterium]